MKKIRIALSVLLVGMVGLMSCGQVPNQPAPLGPGGQGGTIPLAPEMAPPPGEVLFQDSFDTSVMASSWSVLDISQTPGEQADWHPADGRLVQGGTTLGSDSVDPALFVANSGADWSDYIARVNIYVETNDEVGLIFRVNESGFYRLRMRSASFDGPYQVGFDRFQDGHFEVLWHQEKGGFPVEKWFTLQIAAKGDTFVISVDGKSLGTVQDSAFAKGGVGVFAWSEGGAYFDNLVVVR